MVQEVEDTLEVSELDTLQVQQGVLLVHVVLPICQLYQGRAEISVEVVLRGSSKLMLS